MDTYLKSALFRYDNRPNDHFLCLLVLELGRCSTQGLLTTEDAQEIMAVAGKHDPHERGGYRTIKAMILGAFPASLEN